MSRSAKPARSILLPTLFRSAEPINNALEGENSAESKENNSTIVSRGKSSRTGLLPSLFRVQNETANNERREVISSSDLVQSFSRQSKPARASLLPTLFRSSSSLLPTINDAVNPRRNYNRSNASGSIELQSTAQRPSSQRPSISRSWTMDHSFKSDSYWQGQFEARKSAGKHTILTEIEVLTSYSIWLLLFLPVVVTLLLVMIHGSIKWNAQTLTYQSTDIVQNNSSDISKYSWKKTYRSPLLEKFNSFAHTHFHLQLEGDLASNSSFLHQFVNSYLTVTTSVRFLVPSSDNIINGTSYDTRVIPAYDINLYPIYILEEFAGLTVSNNSIHSTASVRSDHSLLKIPLPLLALESMVPRDQYYSPWYLEVNFSSSNYIFAEQLQIFVKTNTLSASYVYLTCIESLVISCCCIFLLIIFCQRLRAHAWHSWKSVSKELPYIYQRQLTSWHFVLPEQYACIFGLCLLAVWSNPFRAVLLLSSGLQSQFFTPTILGTQYCFWTSFVTACTGYGFLSTVVGYVHGLRFNSNAYEEKYLLQLVKDTAYSQNNQNPFASSFSSNHLTVAENMVKRIHTLYILPHHILSVQFLDFFLSRLIWWAASCLICFVFYSVLFTASSDMSDNTSFFRRFSSIFSYLGYEGEEDSLTNEAIVSDWLWWTSILCQLVTIVWLSWFSLAMWRTGHLLKAARLSTSRFRHISYRALCVQLGTGTLLLLGIIWYCSVVSDQSSKTFWQEGVDWKNVFRSLLALYTFAYGWIAYLGIFYTQFLGASILSVAPAAEFHWFVSMATVALVVGLMPPQQVDLAQDRHLVVPLRCQLLSATTISNGAQKEDDESQSLLPFATAPTTQHEGANGDRLTQKIFRKIFGSHQPSHERFCLELACQLLEVAYQTYFTYHPNRPQELVEFNSSRNGHNLLQSGELNPNVGTSHRMDLERLGLAGWAGYSCHEHSTFGLLACHRALFSSLSTMSISSSIPSGDSLELAFASPFALTEHVVAFRGSTLANIAADFKFTLMPLPELLRPRSFIAAALQLSDTSCRSDEKITGDTYQDRINEGNLAFESLEDQCPEKKDDSFSERFGSSYLPNEIESGWYQFCCESGCWDAKSAQPRIHVGFWQSYASIRDQFMQQEIRLLYRLYQLQQRSTSAATKDSPFGGNNGIYGSMFANHTSASDDVRNNNSNWAKIYFTGHSLGAAMALLAAVELAVNMPNILQVFQQQPQQLVKEFSAPEIVVYLFGCPRVGNAHFALLVKRLLPTCYRVQVDGDIVTMVPKFLGFYRHSGSEVWVDKCALGNIVVAPTLLESWMWLKSNAGNIQNHSLEVYRQCLEAGFEKEEYAEYLARETAVSRSLDF